MTYERPSPGCLQPEKSAGRFMKPVRVSMLVLLVAVAGLLSGGCEPRSKPRVGDPPSRPETRQPSRRPPAPSPPTATPRQSPKQSMERLIREMEGKPSLPSQEAPGVARQKAEGGPQEKVPVPSVSGSACPPAWYQQREKTSSDFRSSLGESQESLETAEANARSNIAKSIELHISGTTTVEEKETSDKGYKFSVKSEIVERVDLTLAGISITNSVKCENQWYARAELNYNKAKRAWLADVEDFDTKAAALRASLKSLKDQENKVVRVSSLLQDMYRLAAALDARNQIKRWLRVLTDEKEPKRRSQVDVMTAQQDYDYKSFINSFRVELLDGDDQQAEEQLRLRKPFVIQSLAGFDPPFPIAGVSVLFTVTKGQIKVKPDAKTGTDGKAEVVGSYSESSPAEVDAEVKAEVLLDRMEGHFPPSSQRADSATAGAPYGSFPCPAAGLSSCRGKEGVGPEGQVATF